MLVEDGDLSLAIQVGLFYFLVGSELPTRKRLTIGSTTHDDQFFMMPQPSHLITGIALANIALIFPVYQCDNFKLTTLNALG